MQFVDDIPRHNTIDALAGRLYDTESPLTAAQAGQLAQFLRQMPVSRSTHPRMSDPGERNAMDGVAVPPAQVEGYIAQTLAQGGIGTPTWTAPINDFVISKATSVLSLDQLAALRHLQRQQLAQLKLAPPPPRQTPELPQAAPKSAARKK